MPDPTNRDWGLRMVRAWASGPDGGQNRRHSWAAVLACRVPDPTRSAVSPLTFGPANWVRALPRPESDGASSPDPTDGD